MKPRLESSQWTYEDIQIWTAVAERFGSWLTGACCESDRRDADLMLQLERTRLFSKSVRPRDYPHRCMAHVLMRAELRESGTFNWH